MALTMQLCVVGTNCQICIKQMKTIQTEKCVFFPETVAHLCPFPSSSHLQGLSSYFFHQPLLSHPLHAVTLIIRTSFTFISSVSISKDFHSSVSLRAFGLLPRLAHPSIPSSLMTAAGSSINSRGVWCVCVYCCAE